jgi:hypothetical protein
LVSLLSVIGLAFDLVGAAMLALGLFRGTKPLLPGYLRPPDAAAEDQAYGAAGFLLLAVGFILQALSAFDLGRTDCTCWGILGGVAGLLVGAAAAYLLYGVVFIWRDQREIAAVESWPPMHRERQGLRFWTFVED